MWIWRGLMAKRTPFQSNTAVVPKWAKGVQKRRKRFSAWGIVTIFLMVRLGTFPPQQKKSNNPINVFPPAATNTSRHLYFLCAYACWSHQSTTRLPRFGLSNGYKVVLNTDFRKYRSKYPSHRSILFHTNNMVELAQALDINTLPNVYVVKELIHE